MQKLAATRCVVDNSNNSLMMGQLGARLGMNEGARLLCQVQTKLSQTTTTMVKTTFGLNCGQKG